MIGHPDILVLIGWYLGAFGLGYTSSLLLRVFKRAVAAFR